VLTLELLALTLKGINRVDAYLVQTPLAFPLFFGENKIRSEKGFSGKRTPPLSAVIALKPITC